MSTVEEGEVAGWRTLTLADERLRVTVLPDKGASIYELMHGPSGVDVLFRFVRVPRLGRVRQA